MTTSVDEAEREARAARKAVAPSHAPETETETETETELVQKDNASDAYFFSSNWCRGCMGMEGTRFNWMPSDRPVCTNAPEACVTSVTSWGTSRYSKNMSIAGYNQMNSGNATIRWTLDDPCQNDSWWSRTTSSCKKGSLLLSFTMAPRTAYGLWTSSSGAKWDRTVQWTGSKLGLMFDVWN